METNELKALLDRLRDEPHETEWLEFKSRRCEPQVLGEYLSAISNSACLQGKTHGYLVFGIEDRTHTVVGTNFDPEAEKGAGNQPLLLWLSSGLHPNVGFEVHPFTYQGQRIVLFDVRAAFDRPVKFYGAAYVRIGSSKTELAKYPEKERMIWQRRVDWSAQVCERASFKDLNSDAVKKARQEFSAKFPSRREDVSGWDDTTFLNKARVIVQGAITNAALLLLGEPEAATLLSPAVARISWILRDDHGMEEDYEHFGPPFLLSVDHVLAKIRNLTFRAMPSGTLFPIEIKQYDSWVLREALHNCIAHQDYALSGRINVVETPDALLLTNVGTFLPGDVEKVIHRDAPLEIYRNPFLCEAMVNLNMIDTQGGGIKRMYLTQARRFFPLPHYDLSASDRVAVRLDGRILDERYSRLLMERADLDLWTVILLDKIQKHLSISKADHRKLKAMHLVEGRYPNLFVSGRIAAATGDKARHIKYRGFNKKYYIDIITELIKRHQPVSREDIDTLLSDKLPDALTEKQKKAKIHNMLSELSRDAVIRNIGARKAPQWVLTEGLLLKRPSKTMSNKGSKQNDDD
ncbi:MAG: RNA-binding domain-containing protein [Thermodesulfobacteriota bacterium]